MKLKGLNLFGIIITTKKKVKVALKESKIIIEPKEISDLFIDGLKINKDSTMFIHKDVGMTSIEGVFAAGGVAEKVNSLIDAMACGKRVANNIDNYIKKKFSARLK